MTKQPTQRFRPGPHVYLYFWIALLIVCIVPAIELERLVYTGADLATGLAVLAIVLAVFQCVFWFARRRCSSADLPAWDGLLLIATYMTIGVGYFSLLIVVPSVILGVLLLVLIAIASVFDSDATRAAQRFGAVVAWFSRHRMYQ